MARTPPKTPPFCYPRGWVAAIAPIRRALAIVGVAALLPVTNAQAARSCEEWSAEVTSVEGRVQVRRNTTSAWMALVAGDRVCTDDTVRVEGSSRATLVLPDGGDIRLDENSILNLPEPPSAVGSLLELVRGLIHVISRDPRALSFRTPYANAGLEGTEFDIRVDDDERLTEIVVLEGEVEVTTASGGISVAGNHVAVAREGRAPTATALDQPIELMRWASHYPDIIAAPLPGPDDVPAPVQQADANFFAYRAAARLTTARIEAAEADIAAALNLAPGNSAALSLRALLALARADRDAARTSLAEALASDPQSVVARLALSHVEERSGELAAAERVVRQALAIEPANAIAETRIAELALAQNDAQTAIESATRARSLAPNSSAPLVVLGFANLRAFDTAAAENAFMMAVELERDDPLPWLGLGLASIRRGDLAAGRRHLEQAVALDPANPLTRSYMAKAYGAENRGDLTASQLDLAMDFDSGDPTPWVYSSLQKLRTNRPIEALQDLRLAANKNGDRPIFRGRLSLDEDIATRSAGLGRMHAEVGSRQLGLLDAWQTLGEDPADFAGHRLLADAYATEPRHEIARVSELLVSQLLQPANVTPLKPQLGQENRVLAQRAGPSATSFDELDSPVVANGLKLRASGAAGSNGVEGHDVSLAGLRDRVSYSVGHYRFSTDGFRDNNDFEQEVANAFVQYRPSYDTNLQAELRSTRSEHGDLTAFFNRDLFSSIARREEDMDSLRLGAQHRLARNHTLLGSLIYQDGDEGYAAGGFEIASDRRDYGADLQHIYRAGEVSVQSGALAAHQASDDEITPLGGVQPFSVERTNRQLGLYTYAYFDPLPSLSITAGVSLDSIESSFGDNDETNPKLGLVWHPAQKTTVRAAAFETLFGSLTTSTQNTQPRLEPVQVAGFTQLLFGGLADRATVQGLAIDQELSANLFLGYQAESRETDRPVLTSAAGADTIVTTLRERAQKAYLYWMPLDALSVTAGYEHGRYSSEPVELFGYSHMKMARLPLEIRYFARGGLAIGARASHVEQSGEFQTALEVPPPLAPGEDQFVVVDAFVGYRLPNRRGLLSLNADNLLDETFQFQDVDPTNPSLFPERLVSLRFTLAFE
jgi:tetratricopeptide (TPR) repeat protein